MITLSDYITQVGSDRAARKFGVTKRAADSWRRCERAPDIGAAARILQRTGGVIDLEGIYRPYLERKHPECLAE